MRRLLALVLAASLLVGCGSDQDGYCSAVEDHQEELTEIAGSTSPDALLEALDVFRDLADEAPSDITDEWEQVVGALEALQAALDDAGIDASAYDPKDPPAGLTAEQEQGVADAATRVGNTETAQALRDLDQQARDVCHTPLSL